MSSLSSISAGGTLSTFLQRLSSTTATSGNSNQVNVSSDTPAATFSNPTSTSETSNPPDAPGFFSQVQTAVTSALQTAQSSGSTQTPDQIVQSAIQKVVQANGGAAGHSGVHGGHHHHHGAPPAPSSTDNSTAAATVADGSDPSDPNSPDASNPADSATASFLKTLSSFGVDAKQFHQDFVSAVSQAQSGESTAATSNVFSSIPVGSAVDTYA